MSVLAPPSTVAVGLYEAGVRNLVCVIPPGVTLSSNSKIRPSLLGKVPGKKGRQGWWGYNFVKDPPPTREECERWDSWGANIGMMGKHFPALDIDVEDQLLAETLQTFASTHFGSAPVRLSREPRRLLVYRTEEPFRKVALRFEYRGEKQLVEFLGEGRQYLVHGTHPSGVEYRWDGDPLWEWDPNDIPLITRARVEEFFAKLQSAHLVHYAC